jgi:hypothetical protein
MTDRDTMDVLTGVTLVAAFLGFFAVCAMLVEWVGLDLASSGRACPR